MSDDSLNDKLLDELYERIREGRSESQDLQQPVSYSWCSCPAVVRTSSCDAGCSYIPMDFNEYGIIGEMGLLPRGLQRSESVYIDLDMMSRYEWFSGRLNANVYAFKTPMEILDPNYWGKETNIPILRKKITPRGEIEAERLRRAMGIF